MIWSGVAVSPQDPFSFGFFSVPFSKIAEPAQPGVRAKLDDLFLACVLHSLLLSLLVGCVPWFVPRVLADVKQNDAMLATICAVNRQCSWVQQFYSPFEFTQ